VSCTARRQSQNWLRGCQVRGLVRLTVGPGARERRTVTTCTRERSRRQHQKWQRRLRRRRAGRRATPGNLQSGRRACSVRKRTRHVAPRGGCAPAWASILVEGSDVEGRGVASSASLRDVGRRHLHASCAVRMPVTLQCFGAQEGHADSVQGLLLRALHGHTLKRYHSSTRSHRTAHTCSACSVLDMRCMRGQCDARARMWRMRQRSWCSRSCRAAASATQHGYPLRRTHDRITSR
jgi:hypothetical protein